MSAARRGILAVHRYLGLLLAGFLLMSGLTGSVIAFYPEIDALLNPQLFRIDDVGGKPLPPSELVKRLETAAEGARVTYLPLPATATRAIVAFVEPTVDPDRGGGVAIDYDEVFVDPVTGKITGDRSWGRCCERKNLVPFLFKLHNRLLLPTDIGRPFWGAIAVAWLLMSVIGLYLSLPVGRFRIRDWARAWTVGFRPPAYRLQWHRAGGLWFWPVSLCIAASGMAMAFDGQWFRPMTNALSPLTSTVWDRRADDGLDHYTARPVSFDAALAVADMRAARIGIESRASEIAYSAGRGLYRVGFGDHYSLGAAVSYVYVDAPSGEIVGARIAGSGSAGDRLYAWVQALHGGRLIGLAGRFIVFLAGVVLAGASVTGVMIWWRRRRRCVCAGL